MHFDAPPEDLLNLLQALPNPVALFSQADGRLLAANAQFCAVLDLPEEERTQIVGNGFSDGAAGSASLPCGLTILSENLAHFRSPSGVRPLLQAGIRPLRLGGDGCWLVTPSANGFSEDAQQDDPLTERYRFLLENLNEIIYINDIKADVVYVSPNIRRVTGFEAREVIGKNFTAFVHPDDLEGRIDVFLKILAGQEQATEYRMITKTGESKWVRTNARPVFHNGKVVGVQGALVDVTDLKETEEALRHSEEKYRNVVQNARDAIFVLQDDYIRFMNPSASDVLGYDLERIADRPFVEFIHPDDRNFALDRYSRRLAGKILLDNTSFRILNRDEEIKDVEVNAVLISWENAPAVLYFLRDITLQKKMEAQLHNAQKLEALGTLSGGIAHNFNNLLMGIHGNGSLAMAALDPSTEAHLHLEKILGLVQSGSKLTRQLLEYARGRASEMGRVDINQLVTAAAETLAATRKQIEVRFNLSGNLPGICADQGQIEQVMLNLLLNSADAMPDGGEVFIETTCLKGAQAQGEVSLAREMEYVLIKVSDNGTGISGEILHRIFEPFFTTKGLETGTGLGLSTAYGIIKNHDGDVSVESQVGSGSTFSIYLPAIPAEGPEQVVSSKPRQMEGHGNILLVDDEPHVLYTSAAMLEHMGFRVFQAISSEEALDIFRQEWEKIDLVILDLILPNISGKELYYRFKETNPEVKVYISSGYSQGDQAEELIADGCLGFIPKPYDIKEISAMIMEVIAAG